MYGEDRTLIAVMAANNETGVVQPVAEISRLCRAAGALLLVDAVTAGQLALDARLCDYLTLSGHKLGAPQGVGALIASDAAPLVPQLVAAAGKKACARARKIFPALPVSARPELPFSRYEERTGSRSFATVSRRALKDACPMP